MKLAYLALSAVFLSMSAIFFSRSRRESDARTVGGGQFVGGAFLFAGVGFAVAALISLLND